MNRAIWLTSFHIKEVFRLSVKTPRNIEVFPNLEWLSIEGPMPPEFWEMVSRIRLRILECDRVVRSLPLPDRLEGLVASGLCANITLPSNPLSRLRVVSLVQVRPHELEIFGQSPLECFITKSVNVDLKYLKKCPLRIVSIGNPKCGDIRPLHGKPISVFQSHERNTTKLVGVADINWPRLKYFYGNTDHSIVHNHMSHLTHGVLKSITETELDKLYAKARHTYPS